MPDVIAAEATSETHRSPTRATAGPWQRIAPAVSLVAPPLVVAVLTVVDGFTGEAASWPGTASILAYAAAASLPLLARRRYPAVVMMLLTLASAVPLVLGFPVADGPLGIVVAAHALASYRSRAVAVGLAACGVGTISVLAALLAVAYAAQLGSLLVVFSAVAIYVGETDQLARTHLATLADRLRDAQEQDRLRERAAVAEQRAAAARDLHDSIGHALSLIVVQAGAVRLALSTAAVTGNRAAETLSAIEASVQKALADLERGLDLTPDQPLGAATEASPAALQDLTDAVRATGTPVQLKADDLGEVPASLHTAVYRLVQEALTNVVKHAPGAATEVVVGRHGDTVQVRIANTTPGSAASAHLPSGSRGLAGMRERAALFGGRFAARPRSDGGFVVEATLPVPSPAPDAPARRP